MAHTKEAYYFSHDSNARNDEKVLALRIKHDWKGYGLFWALVEKLRDSTDYKCVKDYNIIAFDLRVDAGLIKSIIEDFGLFVFTDCGKYFYSERLCESMDLRETRSETARENAKKRWENSNGNATAMPPHSNGNAIKGKERKRKESKINTATPPPLDEFLDYCEEKLKGGNIPFTALKFAIQKKYEAWAENGWQTGKNQPIKNWKSTILNTLPFLNPTNNGNISTTTSPGLHRETIFDKP